MLAKAIGAVSNTRTISASNLDIRAILNPSEYVEYLKNGIKTASDRIILSALYLGSGEIENSLISEIGLALKDESRKYLQVKFILDHSRSLRGTNNSVTMLSKLVDQYHPRFQMYLYEMPHLRTPFMRWLPGQIREALGVYHCKYNVFDKDVILTGANLSHDYFTLRQDRYLFLKSLPLNDEIVDFSGSIDMADYLNQFTTILSSHCHEVRNNETLFEPIKDPSKLKEELQQFESATYNRSLFGSGKQESVFHPIMQHSGLDIHEEKVGLIGIIRSPLWAKGGKIKIATPYTSFHSSLMGALLTAVNGESTGGAESDGKCEVSIIHPSKDAHGFGTATGLKSYIPKLHQCAYEQAIAESVEVLHGNHSSKHSPSPYHSSKHSPSPFFLVKLLSWLISTMVGLFRPAATGAGSSSGVVKLPTIFEYSREGWTFHSKGMWFWPANDAQAGEEVKDLSLPVATYIGSSNFGERSWTRDFELGFLFATENRQHRELLQREYHSIERWCVLHNSNSGGAGTDCKLDSGHDSDLTASDRRWLPAVARLIKSFL